MPRPHRRWPSAAARSCASGGSSARPWPTAWRRPGTSCSPSHACRRANGSRPGPPMRLSACTRSSSGGSKPKPCCPRQKQPPCCSGPSWHRVRSRCARSTGGRPSPKSRPLSPLTSRPEPIPSPRWRTRRNQFQHRSRRHPDGIRFVVRYVRNAKKRPAAKKASKYAIVIKYLLDQGIEPAAIPAELAKPKNGINAICQKASGASSADTPEGNDRAKLTTDDTRIGTKAQPENDWSDDDNDWSDDDDDQPEAEVKGEQPSSEPQKLKVSGLVSLGLHGEAEIVKKEEAFQEDEEMFMRVRVRKTKSGKRYLKLLDVVPPLKLPKAVKASARMKNDPRDAKAASRRPSQGLH